MNNTTITILGLDKLTSTVIIACAGVLLLAVILLLARGIRGSQNKRDERRLEKILQELRKDEVQNIVLPDGLGGLLEIERLILMEQGLLIINTLAISGHLFGADNINNWTQVVNGRSFKFNNPLQHIDNAKYAVQSLAPKMPVFSRVVFTEQSYFPKGKPNSVSTLDSLKDDLHGVLCSNKTVTGVELAWERITRIARQSESSLIRGAGL